MNRTALFMIVSFAVALCSPFASAKLVEQQPVLTEAASASVDDSERTAEVEQLCSAYWKYMEALHRHNAFDQLTQIAVIMEERPEVLRRALFEDLKIEVLGTIDTTTYEVVGFGALRTLFGQEYGTFDIREISLKLRMASVDLHLRIVTCLTELQSAIERAVSRYPDIAGRHVDDLCPSSDDSNDSKEEPRSEP